MLTPLAALAWALAAVTPPPGPPPRPNVLLISTDDLAPYAVGAYGCATAKTPRIDELAKQSVRFDRAYCNSPVCTASRQSFLTGRTPRSLGVTQLQTPLPAGTPTLATMLKAQGYATAAIGKMHFNSNLKHGFDLRIDAPDHRKHLAARGKTPVPDGVELLPPWKPFQDPARVWLNADTRPLAMTADLLGTFYADQAGDYLMQKRDRPFFLVVSFTQPHSPFHFGAEDRDLFAPGDFAVPHVGPEDDWQIPAIFRPLTTADKQSIAASYHTAVASLDRQVGTVLDALQSSGHANDTVVVFLGDHGYLLGHHGRFEKHCQYEEAIRSPLLIRWPGVTRPGATDALTEFIDIAPTLLDATNTPVPESVQGRSLVKLLKGETATHRDHVVVEYSENEEACVRTAGHKLVYSTGTRLRQDGYETGRPLEGLRVRLYDLEADPGEFRNVAADHPETVARLTETLRQHLRATARVPVPPHDDIHAELAELLRPNDVTPSKR